MTVTIHGVTFEGTAEECIQVYERLAGVTITCNTALDPMTSSNDELPQLDKNNKVRWHHE